MRKLVYLACVALVSISAAAYEIAFTNGNPSVSYNKDGCPVGWKMTTKDDAVVLWNEQPQTVGNESGLRFNFKSASENAILYTTNAVIHNDEIPCDNVFARIRVLVLENEKIDKLQLLISTNNFENGSYEEIGEPIALAEPGLAVEKWVTVERSAKIPGLSTCGHDVSVGVLAIPFERSGTYGYLQSIDLRFVASATPQDVCIKVDDADISSLMPGETNVLVQSSVNPYPAIGKGEVTVTGVKCVLDRNGIITTNAMTQVGSPTRWQSNKIAPAIDAGERLKVSIISEYTSDIDTLGKKGADGIAREQSDWVEVRGTKKGSVWINEFAADRVELCGTTNRVMLAGWKIELATNSTSAATYYADLEGDLCFTNNMINGVVGLDTRELDWRDDDSNQITQIPDGTYYIRLRNSAGVVEHGDIGHLISVKFPIAGSVGMSGYAAWSSEGYGYDWTGTADGTIFTWGALTETSLGKVNVGQGFKAPITAMLKVKTGTYSDVGGTNLSYVTVIAKAYGVNNDTSLTTSKEFPGQSEGGVASILIKGVAATPDTISADISASAFGWSCESKSIVIQGTNEFVPTTAELRLIPIIAADDFEGGKFKSFWERQGYPPWEIVSEGGRGVLRLNTKTTDEDTAILRCKNFLSPRGRKYASVSFDFMNSIGSPFKKDKFRVEFATNSVWTSGTDIITTPPLEENRDKYEDKEWYHYHVVFELPEGFENSEEIWIRLVCDAGDRTSSLVTVDDLQISFQDVALPTNLVRTVETPMSGGSTGFVLDVLPQTTDEIEEVSADLHITVEGDKWVVPFAFADGALTNAIPLATGEDGEAKAVQLRIPPEALEKVCGKFYAGQTVEYYAAVHYNSANGDTDTEGVYETRYFPDNHADTTIGDTDYWIVEGEYKAIKDQFGFTVDGPDIEILGTPKIGSNEITFDYHAWDSGKGKSITNLTVTVVADGYSTNHVMYAGEATNRVMNAFVVPGLDANTEYTFTLSGQRNTGRDLTPTNYTFVTLPVLMSAKIDGISATEAKLTVSGQAAGYVVTPDAWKVDSDSATTWTWGGGSPDSEYKATVYATNKVGVASVATNTVSGYTLAAVAKGMPTIEKVVNEVKVWAPDGYVATQDGNQSDTEYTVRVVTSSGKTNDVDQWQTLADWKTPVVVTEQDIDLEATNNFWFITRNHDGIVTGNDNENAMTNCWFELVADITNVVQKAEPFGTVDIALKFFDPARKTATATVQYKFADKGGWTNVCEDDIDVHFTDFTAGTTLSWDARAAVKRIFAEAEWDKEHKYSLQVRLTAGPRTSEWMVKDGCEVDFTKPEVTEFSSDVPAAFNKSPMTVTVKFSKQVVDFTAEKVEVGNGMKGALAAGPDNTYTIDVTPVSQGQVTVQIKTVKDKFGNESEPTSVLTKTYDTGAPVWDEEPITGTPANGSATNGTWYALTAHAKDKDNLTAITYHWSFDEKKWTDGQEFTGNVTGEKGYTAYVYVTDAAGNVSTTNTWSWTYDKTAPVWETPAITGTPANGSYTNKAHYALTARATDNLPTEVPIYYWSFDKKTWTKSEGPLFENDVTEGDKEYTLYVYATDRAGNVAPTNTWCWTYDTEAPSVPVMKGAPTDKSVTKEKSYGFTAKSEDNIKDDLTYSWQLQKGADVKKSEDKPENEPFGGNDLEDGIYTVTVNAKDKAGNTSVSTNWTWTVDNTPPEKPVISGTPAQGVHTNVNDFAFTANSETVTKDLTKLTYHWLTNGVWAADITNFIGYVTMEGEHTVSVYATDKAGNTSETNSLSWVYDRTPPDKPNFTAECNPKDNDITNDPSYFFKASSSDKLSDFVCYWKKSWVATEKSGNSIEGNLGNEANDHFWVEVWAKDMAGNVSATNRLSWTLDQIPPELLKIDPANPTNGAFTAETTFNFKGNATDNLTTITYHWLTNGVWAADVTNLTDEVVGKVAAEGQHTYSVYATDAAGNFSKATNSVTWTVDWSAPTNLVVIGEPSNGAVTNLTSFALKAMAMDLTKPTICWTLDEGQMVKTPTNVEFKSSGTLSQGLHTVECYAVDQAGNQSEPTDWTWTVDTEAPVVAIKPDGVGDVTFVYPIPMKMTVRDAHEVVTALTAGDFVITATNEVEDVITDVEIVEGSFNNDGNTNYTFKVTSPEKALYGPVWISVKMNKAVADEAGNKSALAEGGVISDRTQPGVTIWTDAPSTNNAAVVDYKLSIASFSPITNNLAAGNITVPSGCNVTDFKGIGETIAGGIYTNYSFQVATRALVDTLMTVSLPAGSVFNRAGNSNDVATANMVMSDHTPPVPVLACVAASLTNNLPAIPFEITVVETNGLRTSLNGNSIKVVSGGAEIKNFSGSGLKYSFNVVPKNDDVGEIKVKVDAGAITDFAGNPAVASEVVSVVSDRTEPTATMATATDLSLPRKDDTIEFTVALADTQNHLSAEGNYLSTESFVPANCTVTKVEGKGLNYTVRVSPISDGEVAIGVKGGAFKDAAENTNKASKVMSFISDRTKPVVKIDGVECGTTKSRHFEMKISAKDTPETTNVVWYSWSVKGNGQSFGEDFVEIGTNDTDVAILRGTGLNDGAWNWTVKFKDIAGNVTTSNGAWTVKSDVAPELALDPTTGTVVGSPSKPLVFTLTVPKNDIELTKKFDTNMVVHVSGGQVFYRRAIKIENDSKATITLTPVKQDRDFTDVVTLTIPCGAAIGTNKIAAATVSGKVTYKFSGTNKNPEAVRVVRAAGGYLDDPHRTNANLGETTLIAKTLNGAKFKSGFTKASITGAPVKSVTVASDRLSATITLTADARKQLVDIDGWKGFKLAFAGGSVESLPSPIPAGSQVTVPVKVWRNLARVAGADGAAIKVDEADAPLAHDGDARTAQVEGAAKLAATFPRARVNAVYVRLSAASAKDAYKPTKATVTLKRAGQTVETIVTDLVWDGKRCAPVDLLVTPQDTLLAEAVADEAALSFTGSTKALYLDEFAVFGLPEALDPLCPEILSVNPVAGGFVVQTDMGVSNWVTVASDQALKLESDGVTTGVAIDWAQIDWADATRTALKVPISGSADAGYVGGATLHVYEGFLGNFIGRSNICETISTTNLTWNSQTVPEAVSFTRYDGAGESVAFDADALMWTLMFNQPVLNLSGASFDKHDALGSVQVLGTGSPTNYIVRAQLNCWTNEVSDVKVTLKAGAVKGLTGKSNADAKASETYKLEKVKVIE